MSDILQDTNLIPDGWKESGNKIKVIGVGGGGCNAVSYMYNNANIAGADFVVCNTDVQTLKKSPVPTQVAIGECTTKGLGAGCNPLIGKKSAIESQDRISALINDDTEIVFVTCGMGGGTGTGAGPIIAELVHNKGVLTVGVVTIPSNDEGRETMSRAIQGVEEMIKVVDSLLIINNQKLYEVYGQCKLHEIFPKSDEVLATAVRGISEIITDPGYINVDFADVKNMMKNSGISLMGNGTASGENRVEEAVRSALSSPLLNDFDLTTARSVLVNIRTTKDENGIDGNEYMKVSECIAQHTGSDNNFKKGIVYDESNKLDGAISITIIATGFSSDSLPKITSYKRGDIIIINDNYRSSTLDLNDEEDRCNIVDLPNLGNVAPHTDVIGRKSGGHKRLFSFVDKEKPVLALEKGANKSKLSSEPAIRRREGMIPISIN